MEIVKLTIAIFLILVAFARFLSIPYPSDFYRISLEQINTYLICLIFLTLGVLTIISLN